MRAAHVIDDRWERRENARKICMASLIERNAGQTDGRRPAMVSDRSVDSKAPRGTIAAAAATAPDYDCPAICRELCATCARVARGFGSKHPVEHGGAARPRRRRCRRPVPSPPRFVSWPVFNNTAPIGEDKRRLERNSSIRLCQANWQIACDGTANASNDDVMVGDRRNVLLSDINCQQRQPVICDEGENYDLQ